MQSHFLRYLGRYAKEGERLARLRVLCLYLELLDGSRKIAVVFFTAFLWSTLLVASVFSALVYGVTKYETLTDVRLDAFLMVMLVSAMVAMAALIDRLREKRWLEAFGVLEMMESALSPAGGVGVQSVESKVQSENREKKNHDPEKPSKEFIKEIVQEVLKDYLEERTQDSIEKPKVRQKPRLIQPLI